MSSWIQAWERAGASGLYDKQRKRAIKSLKNKRNPQEFEAAKKKIQK